MKLKSLCSLGLALATIGLSSPAGAGAGTEAGHNNRRKDRHERQGRQRIFRSAFGRSEDRKETYVTA